MNSFLELSRMIFGAIAATDILFYHPAVTTEGDAYGGTIGTTTVGTTKNALWDDVSGAQAYAGTDEYRKIFLKLHSNVGADVLSNPVVWVASTTPGGDEILIKAATAAADSSNVQSDITGESFITPTAKTAGVALDNIASDTTTVAYWLKRNVPASTSGYADDAATIRIEGEV